MANINIPSLSFFEFLDLKKFQSLKKLFLQQDLNFDPYSDINFDKETILFKVHNFEQVYFGNVKSVENEYYREIVEDILLLNFFDDFLLPAITLIPFNLNQYIKLRLKTIYGKDSKIDFYERLNDYLLETVDKIQESDHLSVIEENLVETAFKCLDNINQNIAEIKTGNRDTQIAKIPFNLRKIEVLYLFEQMHIHNIIHKSITRVKLFGLVNQYFTFSGNKTISNSYNAIQDYKDGRKNNQKVLSNLSDKFENIFSK